MKNKIGSSKRKDNSSLYHMTDRVFVCGHPNIPEYWIKKLQSEMKRDDEKSLNESLKKCLFFCFSVNQQMMPDCLV